MLHLAGPNSCACIAPNQRTTSAGVAIDGAESRWLRSRRRRMSAAFMCIVRSDDCWLWSAKSTGLDDAVGRSEHWLPDHNQANKGEQCESDQLHPNGAV